MVCLLTMTSVSDDATKTTTPPTRPPSPPDTSARARGTMHSLASTALHARVVPPATASLRRRAARVAVRGARADRKNRTMGNAVVAMASWWENAPFLPKEAKQAAKENEYFNGIPFPIPLPFVSKPKAKTPGRADPAAPDKRYVLFDFSEGSDDAKPERFDRVWGALNDVVMGGKSEAAASIMTIPSAEGGKCAKLSGVVEGDGGGFVSARTRNFVSPVDVSSYDGVQLRVRGDGRRYKLILRDTEDFFALSYSAGFDTIEGEWIDVELPFEDFAPAMRGNEVARGDSDYRDLRADRVRSLQVMLSKYGKGMGELNPTFASGPFAIEIREIAAFKKDVALAATATAAA